MAKKGNTKYRIKPDKQLVNNVLTALVYIGIGVLFCIFKGQVLNWLIWIVGFLLILRGCVDFISYKLVTRAVVEIALGVLTLVFGGLFASALTIVVGIVIALYGLSNLINNSRNVFTLLVSVLTIVGGILIAVNPGGAVAWMFIVVGVVFIVDGILALFGKKL